MSGKIDYYGPTYGQFAAKVYAEIRAEAYVEDIGQNSWLTADEHDLFLSWLALERDRRLLDVACGSGGPALRATRRTGCRVHGIDIVEEGVATARDQAAREGLEDRATFERVDAGTRLPFADGSFDAILCVDAINHLPDRAGTLAEWARLLAPGGRLVFTNPVVITGPVTSEELAIRSSIGFFLFVPAGVDDALLDRAGFELVSREDHTENMAQLAARRHAARAARAEDLRRIEGDETFAAEQRFYEVAARLARERRLSRIAFGARRRG